MNAAARLLNQGAMSRDWVLSLILKRLSVGYCFLFLSIIVSGLGVIYVTNTARSLNAEIQQLQVEEQHLHVKWGQLLLEKSTWLTQSRIESVAEKNLGMVDPTSQSVIVINNSQ